MRKSFSLSYWSAVVLMGGESIYIAFTVMATPNASTLATMINGLRAVAVPLLFEVFVVGLLAEAGQRLGRFRWSLWALAMAVLAGTALMQQGAMAAHPADTATVKEMGEQLFYGVRLVLGVAGPVVVAATGTIKLLADSATVGGVLAGLHADLADSAKRMADLSAKLGAVADERDEANATAAAWSRRYEQVVAELADARQKLEEARRAIPPSPPPTPPALLAYGGATLEQVVDYRQKGATVAETATALGVTRRQVERMITDAKREGLL
jgi:hypothetical protein